MFEFKMSYLEPGYHRSGDSPFSFPPTGIEPRIDSNLIEIQGKNGTGKTTLLNVLALALGYLDQEKELETKPMLKAKLEDFNTNPSLEYYFRICSTKPDPIELIIERKKGQQPNRWLNSKAISPDTMSAKFDVLFLTEDDPSKVVSASRDKLAGYFNDLDRRLIALQGSLNQHLLDIVEYRDIEVKEKGLVKEIKIREGNIKTNRTESVELEKLLKKVELKKNIKEKLELLRDQVQITGRYQNLREKYERLKGKEDDDLIRKIERERRELNRIEGEIKEYDLSIIQLCTSMGTHGVSLDSKKFLKNDYTELNRLLEKLQPDQKDETTTLHIVDDMITILQRYTEDTVVPLVEKPVRETLKDLYRLKVRLSSDRVLTLAKLLKKAVEQKKMTLVALDKAHERVYALQQKRKDLEGFREIENEFIESEKRYIALQTAIQENKGKMLDEWEELRSVEGDSTELRDRLQELDVRIRTEESMKAKYEENLRNLRENATEKPKYEHQEDQLRFLNERISKMRENLYQWTQILSRPAETRKEFESTKERPGFGLADYQVFVKAVGEYLGEQFEPILYDYKLQKIKFFDIEKKIFVTDNDRKIPIDKLSQGQSKLATLTGTFKKMDPNKKKIVLIDEIADLDPENLQNVKNTLRSRFEDGSLMLTVLVRPTRESSKTLEISGWG